MKDKNNSSIAIIISNIIKFYRNQKYYKYILNNDEEGK